MTPDQKKEISKKLKDALVNEHLWNAQAARHLNLISNYICMILNPKIWEKCPKSAWERVQAWIDTGKLISEFKIPEGEKIIPTAKEAKNNPSPAKRVYWGRDPKKPIAVSVPDDNSPAPSVTQTLTNVSSAEKALVENIKTDILKLKETIAKGREFPFSPERLRIALDIEINLTVNGQKVQIR